MKQGVLPFKYEFSEKDTGMTVRPKRMKAIRLSIISVPGRVIHHAGYLIVKLTRRGNSFDLLTQIRQGIAALLPAPAT